MDEPLISEEIGKSNILKYILIDYFNFEDNTNILILLNGAVKSIISTISSRNLADKLLFEHKLLSKFAAKLRHEDYNKSIAARISIYPFIHNMTAYLMETT